MIVLNLRSFTVNLIDSFYCSQAPHVRVPHATMEDIVPTLVMIHSNADALLDFLEIDVKLKVKYFEASRDS